MGFSFKTPFLPDSSGVHGQIHLHHGVYTAVLKGTHSCPLWLNEWWSKVRVQVVLGQEGDLLGFRTLSFYSRSRATAGTCLHLRAFSAECGRPQSRKRGRGRGGGGTQGPGQGRPGPSQRQFLFLLQGRLQQARIGPACAWLCWVSDRPGRCGARAAKGRRKRGTTHAARARETNKAPPRGPQRGVDARPRPWGWRLHAGGHSAGLQCLLAKASAAGTAAARRMPRPHARRGGSRCSRRPTRAPDSQAAGE